MNFNIDKILSEWAYRSDNGQPNVSNPSHIDTLREILYHFGLPHKFIVEYIHGLNENELVKNPNPKARKKMVTKAYAAQWLDSNPKAKKQDTEQPKSKSTKSSDLKTQSKLSPDEIKKAKTSNLTSVQVSLMMTKTQAKIQAREKGKKNVGLGTPESRAGEAMVHNGIDQMVERVKDGMSFEDALGEVETDFLGMVNTDDHILNSTEGKKWVGAAVATLKKLHKEIGLENIQGASWDTDAGREAIGVDPKVNTSSDMFIQMNDGTVTGISLKKSGKVFILSGGWNKQSKIILNNLEKSMQDSPEEFAKIKDAMDIKHHANETNSALKKATETVGPEQIKTGLEDLKQKVGWDETTQTASGKTQFFDGSSLPKYIKALEDPKLLEKINNGEASKDEQKAYAKLLQEYHKEEAGLIRDADENATKRMYDQINNSPNAKSAMKQFVIKSLHLPETLGLNEVTKAGGIDNFSTLFGSGDDGAILNEETIGTLLGQSFKDTLTKVKSGEATVKDLNKVIEEQIEFDTEKGMIVFRHENNSEYPLFEMSGRSKGIMASLALEIKQTPLMAYALKAGTFNSDDWTEEERKKFGLEMRGEK